MIGRLELLEVLRNFPQSENLIRRRTARLAMRRQFIKIAKMVLQDRTPRRSSTPLDLDGEQIDLAKGM